MLDQLLEKFGLKYEELKPAEKETLNTWMSALEKGQIDLTKVRTYINAMKDGVEQELTKSDVGAKQDLFLKARLRNYMLLDAFLSTPERAKQQLENALMGMTGKGMK